MAKRVIMVDDSKTTRSMVAYTLRRAGYEVLEAEDGAEALKLLATGQVDGIITDLNMPGMGGLELIRQLRTTPAHRTTPILMLTTATDVARQEELVGAGATGWLGKPFHPNQLVEVITGMF